MSSSSFSSRFRLACGVALAALFAIGAYGLWFVSSAFRSREPELDALESPAPKSAELAALSRQDNALETVRDAEAPTPPVDPANEAAVATPSGDFLVQVVDDQGNALRDVPVCIQTSFRRGSMSNVRAGGKSYRFAEGSDEAYLRIPGANVAKAFATAERRAANGKELPIYEIALACKLPDVETTRHVLTSAMPPREPIRLEVAAAGSVRVEVFYAGGSSVAEPMEVRLSYLVVGEVAPVQRRSSPAQIQRTALGCATFRYVRIGGRIDVEVRDPNDVLAPQRVQAQGPLHDAREVRVQVSVGRTNPVLTGMLVDETGKPIASSPIFLSSSSTSGAGATRFYTDARGRFELQWADLLPEGTAPEHFLFAVDLTTSTHANAGSARVLPPEIPPEGTVDLGVVALAKPTLGTTLGAGIVVDGKGVPLPRVQLEVLAVWPISREAPWEEQLPLFGPGIPRTTDAEGRFRLQSSEPCRGLRIDARLEGHFLQRTEVCEVGRDDIRLVLVRGATLSGRVLIDEGIDRRALQVCCADEMREQARCHLDASGEFELRCLRPGLGTLTVGGSSWPFVRIDGVAVPAGGEAVSDERVACIDLRGKLRQWPFRIRGDESANRSASHLLFDGSSDESFLHIHLDPEGRAAPWLPVAVESARLVLEGYEPVLVTYSAEEQVVNLSTGRTLLVELASSVDLPEGLAIAVSLDFPSDARPGFLQKVLASQDPIDVSREHGARLQAGAPGRYLLRWSLRSHLTDRETPISEEPIEVPASSRDASFRLAPPAAELARAVEKLR